MKTYTVWITNKLSTSGQPSPNTIEARDAATAERMFWARIKPKNRNLIKIEKIEERPVQR